MPFTQCVIDETLSLGGIAIWLLREAKADVEYEDFTIPQGCLVVPFLSAVHLDEGIYPEALQFNPWRWLGEENKVFSFVQLEELIYAGSQGMDIKGPTKCSEHIKDQAKSMFIQPTSYFLPMINERWSGLFEEVRSVLANYTDVRLTQGRKMASNFDTFTDKWSSSNLISIIPSPIFLSPHSLVRTLRKDTILSGRKIFSNFDSLSARHPRTQI